jgi:drug/metabolite transporter (DMT)-like permease
MTQALEKQTRWALILLWFVPMLWSVNYIIARKAPGIIGPHLLSLGRWSVAALVVVFLARHELWHKRLEIAKVWWQYLVLGTLGMLICGAWVYQGARSTQAMNIALIYAASPVLISLGSVWLLGENFRMRQTTGVALALIGVVHVVVKGRWAALSQVQFVSGDLWILAATFSWASYALLQKKWLSTLSATARLAAIALGGIVVLIPFSIWELFQPNLNIWGSEALSLIVIAGLLPGLGAYWVYGWAQRILGTNRTAVALYLGPLYAALLTWVILDEAPGWHHLFGGLLILLGVFLVMQRSHTVLKH